MGSIDRHGAAILRDALPPGSTLIGDNGDGGDKFRAGLKLRRPKANAPPADMAIALHILDVEPEP